MPYNFLEQEQLVNGVDIYFFRAVMHNHPDEDVARIL